MEAFQICGGRRLTGIIAASGSKNASFPILAASVLLSTPVTLHNLPDIEDIRCFVEILKEIGAKITFIDQNTVTIDPTKINNTVVPAHLGSRIRGSYYLLGSLIAKFGKATLPYPGGCNVGDRPMDLHLEALKKMGADFDDEKNQINGKINKNLIHETTIVFRFPSRGATINVMLAASLLAGKTTRILNYNKSPETESLVNFLSSAGVEIIQQEDALIITGKSELVLDTFDIIPDKIEVATLLAAGLLTMGNVEVTKAVVKHVQPFLDKLSEIGFNFSCSENSIHVWHQKHSLLFPSNIISGLNVHSLDADFEPILAVLLTIANGESTIEDTMNPQRHSQFLPQLAEMGANIEIIDNTRAMIYGGTVFKPSNVTCKEIRGGAALTLAALAAKGISNIHNIIQIDRGYERLDNKLALLGADIRRYIE